MGLVAQLRAGETMFPPRAPFFGRSARINPRAASRENQSPFGLKAQPIAVLPVVYPGRRSGMGLVAQLVFKTSTAA